MFLIVSRSYVDFGFDHPFFLRAQKVRCLERALSTPESTVPLYVFYTKTIDVLIFFKKNQFCLMSNLKFTLSDIWTLKKLYSGLFVALCCQVFTLLTHANLLTVYIFQEVFYHCWYPSKCSYFLRAQVTRSLLFYISICLLLHIFKFI